jgi:hypothetical protein
MGHRLKGCGVDGDDRANRTRVGAALVLTAIVIGTTATAVVVGPAFNRPTSGRFSMSVAIVPWHEGQPFWVWVPVMLQARSPDWLHIGPDFGVTGVDWRMVNGSQGAWLNISGNHTVSITTWANIDDVSSSTGLQWSARAPGEEGQPRLYFAAGGEAAGPLAVRLFATYSAGSSSCEDTAVASEMLPGDGQVRDLRLEVSAPC